MNQLGLFTKFWQPGTVKTRLAASIGDQPACKLYQAFVCHTLNRLHDSADQRSVVFSPPESESDFRKSIPPNWKLCSQSTGNLGTRMSAFFVEQFETYSTIDPIDDLCSNKVVIIGADCPQIDSDLIRSAFERLDAAPVVIGPSTDGGYYLIAMRERCFDIFADIEWSTERVFSSTVQRLNDQQIDFLTLPPMTDVDDLNSLLELKSKLETRELDGQGSTSFDELDQILLSNIRTATLGGIVESE